ncbi:DUF4175 family protein [Bradyrhizobium sp. CCGB12]|uniref:DUF4175 family protein n=1 Tax=Bradyrhizobium sp. CCGB12 TaxID=2949632 RepID=UPI0020B26A46|nr:DUF4175 family protein [Bradyrhizobium sp. CCGB12]MCP3394369.1 DUF4175 family protein [Bradyrhizobium sp. CCGB12]
MRKLARVPVLKAISIACLAFLLGGLSPVAAQQDQDPDALLDSAEKAMQDSGDSLRQKESGKSLNNQTDAIQKLEEYKRATERSQSSSRDRNVITQRDLDDLLKQIEKAAREGNREAAQRMLEQLAQIMENLQMAQRGQSGESDMEQALNELSDMIRKQQQLRDKTFKQGQDSRRDRSRGKQQGDQSMSDLQQDQEALRDRLKKLQDQLAKRGLAQKGQKGQKGQQGQQGQKGQQGEQGQSGQNGDQDGDQGDDDGSLDDADGAMGDAGSKLGEGNADGAVDSQGKALDALRKGAQKMAEAMQQGDGDGQGDGPGNRAGRQQSGGNQTDPLGRPLHGRDLSDDYTVKIPGEIDAQRVRRILEELRRRLGDSSRPQIELDYIERLLKDF